MAQLLNDNDVALQAAPYRDKTTLVTVVASATNFITAKNGGATTPSSITLTATPNIVFTNAATLTWSYALNTAPTTWKSFDGALIQGTTTFTASGVSAAKAGTYVGLVPLSTTGSGTGLKLNIVKTGTGTDYSTITVTIVNPGVGYKVGDSVVISGAFLGGALTTNNLTLVIGGSVSSESGTTTKIITADTANSLVGASKATSIQFRCAVSENFLDTAYGYALVTYSLEQSNSDSVSIELTRSNSAVNTTSSGTPVNYNNTGTTITVVRAGTQLIYNASGGDAVALSAPNSFSVEIITDVNTDSTVPNRTVGTTTTSSTSWTLNGITSLTADYATVTFLVTVYDAGGYKSQSTYKTLSLNKVASGVNGEPATVYYIDLSAPVITKTTSSKFIDGVHNQIKVYGKKTIGSGAFTTYGFITVTGDTETEASTAMAATSAGYTTTIADTSRNSVYTIKLYNVANRSDVTAVLLDTQVVPVVFNGANGINATLTNDSAAVPVTGSGTPVTGAYENTDTLLRVYEGSQELTYDSVGTTRGTYKITTSSVNITPGTITKAAGTVYATIGIASAILSDTANITFTVTGTSKGGEVFTLTKNQTINKSYPGTDAQLFYLDLSAPVISKDAGSSVIDGAHTVITITGKQTIGNALPTTTGFVTFTPTLALMSSTNGVLKLSGVSSLTVGAPIVFSGTGIPTGITIATTYYIKTIDTTAKTITISATVSGAAITSIANTTSLTSVFAQSEATTATANFIVTSIPNDVGAYSFTAKLYSTAAKTTLLDSALVPILFKGSNAVTAVLTNDSAVIPCDSAATPISGAYTNTGTGIKVYDGTTELTYNGNGSTNGTYTVSAQGSSITAGTISASGSSAVSSQASAVLANLSSIVFTITGKALNGTSINLTKTQTFSKSVNGQNGAPGTSYKSAIVTAYGWSNSSTPPALTGTFTYNWNTNTLSLGTGMTSIYPTGYTETAGASTANNQTLHQIIVTISDVSTATTTANIAWSTAKANKLGYREDGSIGYTGDAARTVYIVTTSATPPGIPTAGAGDVVPTSSDGTWSFQATGTLSSGQFMYQSDGTYKASTNTTTWRAPYLSNLKVGNLSAISANLGNITAGAINIGPDKFVVDSSGNVKIKGTGTGRLEITNENIKVFDSTGVLRVQLGNLET